MSSKRRTAQFDVGLAKDFRTPTGPETQTYPGHYTWPSLRVARFALWQHKDNRPWNDYLNDLASQNRGYGRVRPLGAMSCSLLADVELRHIVLESRPSLKGSLSRTKEYYHALGKEMTQFIRSSSTTQDILVQDTVYAERFGRHPKKISKKEVCDLDAGCAWNDLKVDTDKLEVYGRNLIGIDLSSSPELRHERNELAKFLRRDMKLDTSHMDDEWEAHLSIFEALDHRQPDVDALNWPRHQVMPDSMLLSMPYARIENTR